VSTKATMGISKARRRNKRWPEALKREIVAATMQPGASVSIVARQYNVNANQVFSWRRRFGAVNEPAAAGSSSGLVQLAIMPEPESSGAVVSAPAASDAIEIEVAGDCRIRVGADFDARALKRVLDVLRNR
jgi:transposase-like protein